MVEKVFLISNILGICDFNLRRYYLKIFLKILNEFSKGYFISFFKLKIRFVLFQRAHSNKK